MLLAALGAGIVLALIANQLKPVFLSRGMLATVTGLPVLGAISFAPPKTDQSLLRRDPARIAIAGASLLIAYVLGVGLAEPVSRLIRTIMG